MKRLELPNFKRCRKCSKELKVETWIRKSLIEFDDVNNKQREIIYKQRDDILKNENLRDLILDMLWWCW